MQEAGAGMEKGRESILLERIRRLFFELNRHSFLGEIPEPEFGLSRRLRLSGYVQFGRRRPRMVLSVPYHDRFGWDGELEGTLKHEMVHLLLHARNRPFGHTREFRRLCRQIGGRDYSQALPRPFRYVYECPRCRRTFRYRRRVKLACAACTRDRIWPCVLRLKVWLSPKPPGRMPPRAVAADSLF
jgi:predicted SprT family Zn-dependent metalloprotease